MINCYSRLSWKAATTRPPQITCSYPNKQKRRLSLSKCSGMMQENKHTPIPLPVPFHHAKEKKFVSL